MLVLEYVVVVEFLVLAAAAGISAARHRDAVHRTAAAAVIMLGILPALSRLETDFGFERGLVPGISLALFLGSGLSFLLLRDRFIPLSPAARGTAVAATIGVTVLGWTAGLSADPSDPRTAYQTLVGALITLTWVGCVAGPIVRFWSASRGQPAVQRNRLRSLSAGYFGVLIVAITSTPIAEQAGYLLAIQILVIVVVPLLGTALYPPHALRRRWREADARGALDRLLACDGGTAETATIGLEPAMKLVGGHAAAIVDDAGTTLAAHRMTDDDAARLSASSGRLARTGDGSLAIVVPVRAGERTHRLVVAAGPFTPLFGAHEIDDLDRFASSLGIALARARATESLRRRSTENAGLVHALASMEEGFVVTDGFRLVYHNDAYCRITGYSHDELMAMPSLLDLAPSDERARVLERRPTNADRYESALIHKRGHRVELEVSTKVLQTDDGPRIVSVVRDVTDRKHSEERLLAALDREQEAVRRLEALDEMKNAFLSAVSHELRTPLTGVLGFARTLKHRDDTLDGSERRDLVERMLVSAEKLERLLGDLLDLDRLSRGIIEPRRRPVDVGGLVRRTVRDFRSTNRRDVRVDCDPVVANVDAAQIERVIENLLNNAARHTPEDSPIWVTVREHDGGALVVVEDAGPGVPADLREQIFQPFVQGPNSRPHAPGVGIGLSLVRRFVELHAGTVTVGERNGGGAAFSVHLPEAPIEPPPVVVVDAPRRKRRAAAS